MAWHAGAVAGRVRRPGFCSAWPRSSRLRRRGRSQSHAAGGAARRSGHRDLRLWRGRRPIPCAPAPRGERGDRARSWPRSRPHPVRSPVGRGDRGGRLSQRRGGGGQRTRPVRARSRLCRARVVPVRPPPALPLTRTGRSARGRGQPRGGDPLLSVQRAVGDHARRRDHADRARGGAGHARSMGMAPAPPRRQWRDPGRAGRRCTPVDGQWRRPGLPSAARRLRPRHGRSAFPGGRGQARPSGGDRGADLARGNRGRRPG